MIQILEDRRFKIMENINILENPNNVDNEDNANNLDKQKLRDDLESVQIDLDYIKSFTNLNCDFLESIYITKNNETFALLKLLEIKNQVQNHLSLLYSIQDKVEKANNTIENIYKQF